MIKRTNHTQGFTLIELIVTLSILVLVLAISVPNYMAVKEKSNLKADLATIEMIEKAESHYFAIHSSHSFDEEIEQSPDNFSDSLDTLSNFLEEVTFQTIRDVRWAKDHSNWIVAYGDYDPAEEDGEGDNTNNDANNPPDNFQGDYSQSKNNSYQKDDTVRYNNQYYIARQTAPGIPGSQNGQWNLISDNWIDFNVYEEGNTVEYKGHTYEAKQRVDKNQAPDSQNGKDRWKLIK